MPEISGALSLLEGQEEGANCAVDSRDGSLCELAQVRFEFAEGHLDRIKVGRVLRQIAKRCAGGLDGLRDAGHFVGRQVIQHDDIVWLECWHEALFDIGHYRHFFAYHVSGRFLEFPFWWFPGGSPIGSGEVAMAGQRITKSVVDRLTVEASEYAVWDAQMPGFGVRVRPSGAMSYMVSYRAGSGRAAAKKRLTIGKVGKITPEDARNLARSILGQVAHGRDPAAERRKAEGSVGNTLRSVVENFLVRGAHDRNKIKLRTVDAQRATFERLVYPTLGARQIDGIKRSDINELLDTIEDERGPRMASLTLAYLSRVMNWHASRVDDFRSPIVRGMSKDRGVAAKRDRVLSDEELRAFWRASEAWDHQFARLLQFVLLTATRRDEAADMRWSEVDGDTWTIPAARYKTKIDFELPLSKAVLDLLATTTRLGEFVFTTTGEAAIGGFSKFKKQFDALMLGELRDMAMESGDDPGKITIDRWTIHDLRRTARSAMTQAGVAPDHAERALGHVIAGVRGVYDRHGYRDEKRNAFEALARQIARVVSPQPNVVPMRRPADAAGKGKHGHPEV